MAGGNKDVFINCPFDSDYRGFFHRIVFTITICGFNPRCAWELGNALDARVGGIIDIIRSAKFSIHDLSRTELDKTHGLPRFNMPFELGLFAGAKYFGRGAQKDKTCLVLHAKQFEYQKFISDLAGSDFKEHDWDDLKLFRAIRNFLNKNEPSGKKLLSEKKIQSAFEIFEVALAIMCDHDEHDMDELEYIDFRHYLAEWLEEYLGVEG